MTNSKYEAGALNVDQMLAPNSATFEIPPFQRRYAWGVEEVGELLGDLYEDGNWMGSRSDTEPYFLGSIVLAKNEKGSYLILDGQQRLTTISLLLAVLQHSLQDNGSEIRKYLECGSFGKRKSPKIRLQPEDVETFEDLLNNPTCWSDPSRRRENISKSVQKIIEIVEEHVTNANKRGIKILSMVFIY